MVPWVSCCSTTSASSEVPPDRPESVPALPLPSREASQGEGPLAAYRKVADVLDTLPASVATWGVQIGADDDAATSVGDLQDPSCSSAPDWETCWAPEVEGRPLPDALPPLAEGNTRPSPAAAGSRTGSTPQQRQDDAARSTGGDAVAATASSTVSPEVRKRFCEKVLLLVSAQLLVVLAIMFVLEFTLNTLQEIAAELVWVCAASFFAMACVVTALRFCFSRCGYRLQRCFFVLLALLAGVFWGTLRWVAGADHLPFQMIGILTFTLLFSTLVMRFACFRDHVTSLFVGVIGGWIAASALDFAIAPKFGDRPGVMLFSVGVAGLTLLGFIFDGGMIMMRGKGFETMKVAVAASSDILMAVSFLGVGCLVAIGGGAGDDGGGSSAEWQDPSADESTGAGGAFQAIAPTNSSQTPPNILGAGAV